jgi:hypothetical protein
MMFFLNFAPAFRLVNAISKQIPALAINLLLSAFHFAAHEIFNLCRTGVNEPGFPFVLSIPKLKFGANFCNGLEAGVPISLKHYRL